ncbi:type II toxin-antitoxin system VapC family toxin [Desulfothermobacter acidiphilus]|uniref:type II toxin-antitoxin system VapC family toxin n=1 Tax=Desulfothermobacter acidiphilus TaxID=1938353 RepID=UPI003F8A4D94
MILIDTYVLVYAIDALAPRHEPSRRFVEAARRGAVRAVLVPQVLLEFYAVVTGNRALNPLAPEEALEQLRIFRLSFPVLDAPQESLERLVEVLAARPGIRGGDIFNAWLVAQMRALGISVICTYNVKDFVGFTGIAAHTPEELLGG